MAAGERGKLISGHCYSVIVVFLPGIGCFVSFGNECLYWESFASVPEVMFPSRPVFSNNRVRRLSIGETYYLSCHNKLIFSFKHKKIRLFTYLTGGNYSDRILHIGDYWKSHGSCFVFYLSIDMFLYVICSLYLH
jgi:hypothetical protein